MEETLITIWGMIAKGDPHTVCTMMFVGCVGLIFLCWKQFKIINHLNNRISAIQTSHVQAMERVLNRYSESNDHLISALSEIKIVLATIQKLTI